MNGLSPSIAIVANHAGPESETETIQSTPTITWNKKAAGRDLYIITSKSLIVANY